MALAGMLVAGLLQLGLSFDGSFYLANVLEHRAPFVLFQRYFAEITQAPVLALEHVTSNLAVLRPVYALSLMAVPFAALVASWIVVRHRRPELIVWPLLAEGLVLFPALVAPVFEVSQVSELAWPLLLLTLVALDGPASVIGGLVLSVLLLFCAPSSVVVFGAVAVLSLARWVVTRRRASTLGCWGALMLVLAAVRVVVLRTDFAQHAAESAPRVQWAIFSKAEVGWPLVGVLAGWGLGVAVLVLRRRGCPRRGARDARATLALGAVVVGLLLAGLLATVVWSLDAASWSEALTLRILLLVLELPLVGLAAVDALHRRPDARAEPAPPGAASLTGLVAVGSAIVMAAGLVCVSVGWSRSTRLLADRLRHEAASCVPVDDLGRLAAPLDGWWLGSLAILYQSPRLDHLVAPAAVCAKLRPVRRLPVGGPLRGRYCVSALFSTDGFFRFTPWAHLPSRQPSLELVRRIHRQLRC